jgi:CBS domain containing-hemolysin-like protein
MEAVILSVTPSYIKAKLYKEKGYAVWLKRYKENIDKPLASILTLNTFAHTVGAAGVGAQAQVIWGNEYLTVVSIVLTILILVFSEIIPKTIGANYWMNLTAFTVYTLRVLMVVLYPFVIISQFITGLLNIKKKKAVLARADIDVMARMALEDGILHKSESRIIENIARFDKLKAKDIMTPRTVVFAERSDMKAGDFYKANAEIAFSRIPVYRESPDDIYAYFLKDDLLVSLVEGKTNEILDSLARKIAIVYENWAIPDVYQALISEGEHIALVVDEYGGTAGIVTLEDIIETILGIEIVDEMDNIEDLRKLAREKWKTRAARMGIN